LAGPTAGSATKGTRTSADQWASYPTTNVQSEQSVGDAYDGSADTYDATFDTYLANNVVDGTSYWTLSLAGMRAADDASTTI